MIYLYNGYHVIPMKLIVLDTLCYLGRGWTTDDIQEATAISRETIRYFISLFIKLGEDQ